MLIDTEVGDLRPQPTPKLPPFVSFLDAARNSVHVQVLLTVGSLIPAAFRAWTVANALYVCSSVGTAVLWTPRAQRRRASRARCPDASSLVVLPSVVDDGRSGAPISIPGVRHGLPLHGSTQEAAGQPALHDREEEEARQRREQRRGRERAEADDALDSDELCELDGERDEAWALKQDECEEELVPGRDEREQQGEDDARREQRCDHANEGLHACRTVDRRRLLEVARDPADVALQHPEDERQRPDQVDEAQS